MSQAQGRILVGTSGWSYDHWRGHLYPQDMPNEQWLAHYSQHFLSVEINSSFYHLPDRATLRRWHDTVPKNFIFSVKASRYITHMKKLKDPEQSVARLFEQITELGDKLGPILFQLPPHWHCNVERLDSFLGSLSTDFRYAFEFRDHSWLNDESYEVLQQHRAAFCIYDLDGFQTPHQVTTDMLYVRLHGPGDAYQGSYHKPTLDKWADFLGEQSAQGRTCYCYFDNDEQGYAARNALSLQTLLHGDP